MAYGDGTCERCRRVTWVSRVGFSWLCKSCAARRA